MIFFAKLISRLPFVALYWLSDICAFILGRLIKYRAKVIQQNLKQAFPDANEQQLKTITTGYYQHLCDFGLEMIKAHRMTADEFKQRCTVVGAEAMFDASQNQTKPVIILAIHQGNWEWMLHGVSQHLNIPIDPVYKPLHNAEWNRFVFNIRGRFNSTPIPAHKAARNILKHSRHFRLFVMLADQTPTESEASYWTQYCNKETPFFVGAEKIAYQIQAPVFFSQCRKISRGHYELIFHPLAMPPYSVEDKAEHHLIEAYARLSEKAIYQQPETFLWSHRRWRRDKTQESPQQKQ